MLATRYWSLGIIESSLAFQAAAKVWIRQAHEIRLKRLGAEHPDTRKAAKWLAENSTPRESPDE